MNGYGNWPRVAAIALFVAGALGAWALGAEGLAQTLVGGALLAFPLGPLGRRALSSDPRAVQSLRDAMGDADLTIPGEETARFVLDAAEKRKSDPPARKR